MSFSPPTFPDPRWDHPPPHHPSLFLWGNLSSPQSPTWLPKVGATLQDASSIPDSDACKWLRTSSYYPGTLIDVQLMHSWKEYVESQWPKKKAALNPSKPQQTPSTDEYTAVQSVDIDRRRETRCEDYWWSRWGIGNLNNCRYKLLKFSFTSPTNIGRVDDMEIVHRTHQYVGLEFPYPKDRPEIQPKELLISRIELCGIWESIDKHMREDGEKGWWVKPHSLNGVYGMNRKNGGMNDSEMRRKGGSGEWTPLWPPPSYPKRLKRSEQTVLPTQWLQLQIHRAMTGQQNFVEILPVGDDHFLSGENSYTSSGHFKAVARLGALKMLPPFVIIGPAYGGILRPQKEVADLDPWDIFGRHGAAFLRGTYCYTLCGADDTDEASRWRTLQPLERSLQMRGDRNLVGVVGNTYTPIKSEEEAGMQYIKFDDPSIDALDCRSEMSMINDCYGTDYKKNIQPIVAIIGGLPHLFFITIRPVYDGEELFTDYGHIYWDCINEQGKWKKVFSGLAWKILDLSAENKEKEEREGLLDTEIEKLNSVIEDNKECRASNMELREKLNRAIDRSRKASQLTEHFEQQAISYKSVSEKVAREAQYYLEELQTEKLTIQNERRELKKQTSSLLEQIDGNNKQLKKLLKEKNEQEKIKRMIDNGSVKMQKICPFSRVAAFLKLGEEHIQGNRSIKHHEQKCKLKRMLAERHLLSDHIKYCELCMEPYINGPAGDDEHDSWCVAKLERYIRAHTEGKKEVHDIFNRLRWMILVLNNGTKLRTWLYKALQTISKGVLPPSGNNTHDWKQIFLKENAAIACEIEGNTMSEKLINFEGCMKNDVGLILRSLRELPLEGNIPSAWNRDNWIQKLISVWMVCIDIIASKKLASMEVIASLQDCFLIAVREIEWMEVRKKMLYSIIEEKTNRLEHLNAVKQEGDNTCISNIKSIEAEIQSLQNELTALDFDRWQHKMQEYYGKRISGYEDGFARYATALASRDNDNDIKLWSAFGQYRFDEAIEVLKTHPELCTEILDAYPTLRDLLNIMQGAMTTSTMNGLNDTTHLLNHQSAPAVESSPHSIGGPPSTLPSLNGDTSTLATTLLSSNTSMEESTSDVTNEDVLYEMKLSKRSKNNLVDVQYHSDGVLQARGHLCVAFDHILLPDGITLEGNWRAELSGRFNDCFRRKRNKRIDLMELRSTKDRVGGRGGCISLGCPLSSGDIEILCFDGSSSTKRGGLLTYDSQTNIQTLTIVCCVVNDTTVEVEFLYNERKLKGGSKVVIHCCRDGRSFLLFGGDQRGRQMQKDLYVTSIRVTKVPQKTESPQEKSSAEETSELHQSVVETSQLIDVSKVIHQSNNEEEFDRSKRVKTER